jgi:excreted virulence factor EspC (type VII ESX diderm)
LDQLSVDVAGITRQSAAAGNLAADLTSVQRTWASATQSPAPALGLAELVTAFTAMRQAWDAQFTTYAGGVSEVSENLRTTAANYDAAEKANTASARAVGG